MEKNKYNMTLEQNIFLAKRNLIDNIYASARLEGLNVTFPQTKTILEGVNVPNVKLDEIQCILNLRDAWRYIINNISTEFNLDFICKVNEHISRNESLEWGKLRTGKVEITGAEYIPNVPEEEKVKEEVNKILQIQNPTERAIEYMLYGMRAQLFWDGNKRTSTVCANKIMIENGAGIIKVPETKLEQFNELLTEFYNTGKNTEIKEFIYENCIDGIVIE